MTPKPLKLVFVRGRRVRHAPLTPHNALSSRPSSPSPQSLRIVEMCTEENQGLPAAYGRDARRAAQERPPGRDRSFFCQQVAHATTCVTSAVTNLASPAARAALQPFALPESRLHFSSTERAAVERRSASSEYRGDSVHDTTACGANTNGSWPFRHTPRSRTTYRQRRVEKRVLHFPQRG